MELNKSGHLACAVVHTQQDTALLLQAREGRMPAHVVLVAWPVIGWVCADGLHESVAIDDVSDFDALAKQLAEDGMLVGQTPAYGDVLEDAEFSIVALSEPSQAPAPPPAP